jgi:hypothetical protein
MEIVSEEWKRIGGGVVGAMPLCTNCGSISK